MKLLPNFSRFFDTWSLGSSWESSGSRVCTARRTWDTSRGTYPFRGFRVCWSVR